jgi:hypothetical protein
MENFNTYLHGKVMFKTMLKRSLNLTIRLHYFEVKFLGPVTKIENIKTDTTKILRPTHFGE